MRKPQKLFSKQLVLQIIRLTRMKAAERKAGQQLSEWSYIRNKQPPDKLLLIHESYKTIF